MRRAYFAAAIAVAMATAPVHAKTKYERLETRTPAIEIGKGGTRTQKHGIDYWTSGTPPIRFQILGVITDTRGTGRLRGDAIGSKKIAKLVKEARGNAVVIMSQGTRTTGTVGGGHASVHGNNAYGSGWATAVGETRTTLAVVRYLPDESPAPLKATN